MKSLLQYFITFNYFFVSGENLNAIFMELSSKRLDIIFLVCCNYYKPDPCKCNYSHIYYNGFELRNVWAETRSTYFSRGVNKQSLDCIEQVSILPHIRNKI